MFKVACSLLTVVRNLFFLFLELNGAFPLFSKSQAARVGFTYCSETPGLTSIPTVTLNRDSNPRLRKVRKQ